MSERDERVREAVSQGLRKCRVDDSAPVGLFREGDLLHISHMVTQALLDSPAMRDLLAEAWGEGYRLGVCDEATSQDWTGGAVPPGSANPYQQEAR